MLGFFSPSLSPPLGGDLRIGFEVEEELSHCNNCRITTTIGLEDEEVEEENFYKMMIKRKETRREPGVDLAVERTLTFFGII